jgi:hypothetical protein
VQVLEECLTEIDRWEAAVGAFTMIHAAAAWAATAEVLQITMGINAWEWRWPLGSFVARDASVLSPSALERGARSLAMTQAEYAALLARREAARAAYAALAGQVDAVISVTASGAAPVGLETTGNPTLWWPAPCWGLRASACRCLTMAAYRSDCRCWASRKAMRTCSGWRAGSRMRCTGRRWSLLVTRIEMRRPSTYNARVAAASASGGAEHLSER